MKWNNSFFRLQIWSRICALCALGSSLIPAVLDPVSVLYFSFGCTYMISSNLPCRIDTSAEAHLQDLAISTASLGKNGLVPQSMYCVAFGTHCFLPESISDSKLWVTLCVHKDRPGVVTRRAQGQELQQGQSGVIPSRTVSLALVLISPTLLLAVHSYMASSRWVRRGWMRSTEPLSNSIT